MAEFKDALSYVLIEEGGYVPAELDPNGGETYRGISRNNFPNWDGWHDIDALQPIERGEILDSIIVASKVNTFYKANFWNRLLGDMITEQSVATYLYDWFVNSGGNAIKELQKALGLTVDGGFGKDCLAAVNGFEGDLLQVIHNARIAYYERIGTGKNAVFINGWLNRANGLYDKLK